MQNFIEKEIFYPLNPKDEEISDILQCINKNIPVIFVSYNIHQNKNQQKLLEKIQNKKIIISTGNEYEVECFGEDKPIISSLCPKPCSLLSSAELLIENITNFSD